MFDHTPRICELPEGVTLNAQTNESECPTCHQQMNLYPITLSKSMLRVLWMARDRPILTSKEVSDRFGRTGYGNFTKLQHWEIIEQVETGKWQITQLGKQFLANECRLPTQLWIYNRCARTFPDHYQVMATFSDVVPFVELSREKAAADNIPLAAE